MSFLFPFALFGLLAIPALIIIYILRNKYKEETAPSTYIWEMAAKLLKRKNPLSRFEHLLALIVQCLAIAVFSVALAHPVFTLEGQADDIVFILDSSSSMGMVHEEKTRFERGIELIKEKADAAVNGSTFTLILAEKEPRLVCQNVDDISSFDIMLTGLGEPSKYETSLADSIALAQTLYSEGKANLCYLATDQDCESEVLTNIEWLDCSDDEENYSITDLKYKVENGKITFDAVLSSYASDKDIEVMFYMNGIEMAKKTYRCEKGVHYAISTDPLPTGGKPVESVKAVITNLTDGLMDDNSFTVFANTQQVNTKALVVSANETYLKAIFDAMKIQTTIVKPSAYKLVSGYDLYVYDNYTPNQLPQIGASMFFGLKKSVEGAGFLVSSDPVTPDEATALAWTNNEDSNLYNTLTRGIGMNRDILLKQYMQYSLVNDFTTILTSNKKPSVFVGRSDYGTREVIFNFDLHDSNLPLLYDFVPLMRNLVDYCKPKFLTSFDYTVGDKAIFSIADEIMQVTVHRPDMKEGEVEPIYFEEGQEQYIYETRTVGEHTITITYEDGETKEVRFFVHMSKPEMVPQPTAQAKFALAITDNTTKGDGLLDNILPIIIAAAAFFAADWILYTHEQY